MTRAKPTPRAAWMFEDHESGSLYASGQVAWTAITRVLVVLAYRPLKPLVAWLSDRLRRTRDPR